MHMRQLWAYLLYLFLLTPIIISIHEHNSIEGSLIFAAYRPIWGEKMNLSRSRHIKKFSLVNLHRLERHASTSWHPVVQYNGCKPSCFHCKWGICFHKMIPAVVGWILLLLPRHRLTLDTRTTAGIALDKFTIFLASTCILNPLLNTHCAYQPQKNQNHGREEPTGEVRCEMIWLTLHHGRSIMYHKIPGNGFLIPSCNMKSSDVSHGISADHRCTSPWRTARPLGRCSKNSLLFLMLEI